MAQATPAGGRVNSPRALGLWAALSGALWLGACAPMPPQAATPDSPTEVVTASDESSAHRRARIRTELAAAYLQRGQAHVALDEAKLALQAADDYAPAHTVKALAYMALARPELARPELDRALNLAPNDASVLLNDAWWHCGQAQYQQAAEGFERARQHGAGARAWLGQGVCAARAGEDATPAFAEAHAQAPHDALVVEAWAAYAVAQQDWGRVHEVLTPFNASARATAQSLWLQASAYHQQGQRAQAQRLAQRLTRTFADSPQAAQLKREAWP